MLILQETTIIYYNTTCCTPDDSRQYKTERRLSSREAYFLLIYSQKHFQFIQIQRSKWRSLYHSRESQDERFEHIFFLLLLFQLKTNVRGKMAMARGRDQFNIFRLKKGGKGKRERERKRKLN